MTVGFDKTVAPLSIFLYDFPEDFELDGIDCSNSLKQWAEEERDFSEKPGLSVDSFSGCFSLQRCRASTRTLPSPPSFRSVSERRPDASEENEDPGEEEIIKWLKSAAIALKGDQLRFTAWEKNTSAFRFKLTKKVLRNKMERPELELAPKTGRNLSASASEVDRPVLAESRPFLDLQLERKLLAIVRTEFLCENGRHSSFLYDSDVPYFATCASSKVSISAHKDRNLICHRTNGRLNRFLKAMF